jgi:hypothetical protein
MEFYKVGNMLINIAKIVTITKSKYGDDNEVISIVVSFGKDCQTYSYGEKSNNETYNSALGLYNYIETYLSNSKN